MPDMLANFEGDDGICIAGATVMEKRGATFELAYVRLVNEQIGVTQERQVRTRQCYSFALVFLGICVFGCV